MEHWVGKNDVKYDNLSVPYNSVLHLHRYIQCLIDVVRDIIDVKNLAIYTSIRIFWAKYIIALH